MHTRPTVRQTLALVAPLLMARMLRDCERHWDVHAPSCEGGASAWYA